MWITCVLIAVVAGVVMLLMRRHYARELTQVNASLQQALAEHTQARQPMLMVAYAQIIDTLIEDALVVVNRENVIVACNAVAQALSPNCTPNYSLIAAFRLHELEALLQDARTKNDEILPLQLTFNERLFRVTCCVLADGDGAAIALRDISELQRLGHARRDFVANISHELRTPLASIRLLADSLQRHPLANPVQQDMLTQIGDQTDHLVQLAQEMFDLSLIESGRLPMRLKPNDLHEIVAAVCARLHTQASRSGLTLQNEVPAATMALVDARQIERVITNLVHNAIKFTPTGGVVIGLDSGLNEATQTVPKGEWADEWVTLFVRDTGLGIPKYEQRRIFERFYKLDRVRGGQYGKSGTGLGLAIAKHIVEAHGGQIWVRSAEGKGATFYLTVPTVG